MFGNYITLPHLLIFIPLLSGLVLFAVKNEKSAKNVAIVSSLITLGVSLLSIYYRHNQELNGLTYGYEWLKYIGCSFTVALDGMGRLLTFLTALGFPLIFLATYKTSYKNASAFYALMLLSQAGLMGVFVAMDALLFYFFWELALIPVYFLSSFWGGERRIQATFKFFIYTFAGSLIMLVGLLYVYFHTAPTGFAAHSFSISNFYQASLNAHQQNVAFILFFLAFAIKMPIFPFHTWQPDAYEQAPTSVTMVLSGIMVKMGLFAVIRWLIPLFPMAVVKFDNVVIGLSVVGIIYASLIAIKQDDLKRLVAYSSIAHIGLMSAAIFSRSEIGLQGALLQMFNHGVNIIGLWIVIEIVERQTGVRKISQLSGVAHKAPALTIFLVIIALANIALPLTNAFAGEFMLFNGLFHFNKWYTAFAGIGVILAAVYTLNMIQKVFYGEVNAAVEQVKDISLNEKIALGVIVVIIFVVGIYPQPVINATMDTVSIVVQKFIN